MQVLPEGFNNTIMFSKISELLTLLTLKYRFSFYSKKVLLSEQAQLQAWIHAVNLGFPAWQLMLKAALQKSTSHHLITILNIASFRNVAT